MIGGTAFITDPETVSSTLSPPHSPSSPSSTLSKGAKWPHTLIIQLPLKQLKRCSCSLPLGVYAIDPGRVAATQTCSQGAWKQSLQAPTDRAAAEQHLRIMLMIWTTYLLYGPAELLLLRPALWLLSDRNGMQQNPWMALRKDIHTHNRWMPSWPARDHQTSASSPSSQRGNTDKTSGYGFLNNNNNNKAVICKGVV